MRPGVALVALALAALRSTALAGCSSTGAVGAGTCDACASSDGGHEASTVIKPPIATVDGGISAPCTTTSECSAGLVCLDGACFD